MKNIRQKVEMMSINQMCVYHTILEAYNMIRNSFSECIKRKWEYKYGNRYLLRSESTYELTIPVKTQALLNHRLDLGEYPVILIYFDFLLILLFLPES